MNLVSISCGGLADWGFGMLRDRHVPLNGIFGVFASAAIVSIVLVLLSGRVYRRPAGGSQRTRKARFKARGYRLSTSMQPIESLHELVAATHSPFHADGSLAPEIVPVQAAFLAANGIRTVFITGTTGECHSLTCDERLALFDAWAAAGPAHGLSVIAHVGGNSIEDAKAFGAPGARARVRRGQRARPVVFQAADADAAD